MQIHPLPHTGPGICAAQRADNAIIREAIAVLPKRLPRARFEFTHELERESGMIEVEVGYNVSSYRAASYWSPAEGGEVELVYVARDGIPFTTTDAEDAELIEQAEANSFDDLQGEADEAADYRFEMARDAEWEL